MQRFSALSTLLVGVLASVLAFWWLRQPRAPRGGPEMRPPFMVPVTLTGLERGSLTPIARLTGGVRSPERSNLAFEIAGRIARVHVRDADRVEAGAVLAELDARDLEQELRRARAALGLARAELLLLEAGERPEVVAALEAELASAQATAELARLEVERGVGLLESRVLSQSAYDRLVAERDAAEGRARAARERFAVARAGSRAEDIAIARAVVETREVDAEWAEIRLDKATLRAPFEGIVAARRRVAGDYVQAGEHVIDLFDPRDLEIELEVPAPTIGRLADAGRVELVLDGAAGTTVDATLSAIVPAADPASRNARALVRLDRTDPDVARFVPGAFVEARVALSMTPDAWLVAQDALLVNERGSFLVRANTAPPPPADAPPGPPPPPWVAEWVPVRVLGRDAGRAAVEPLAGALAPDDRIVLVGVDRAFPGAPLMPAALPGEQRPGAAPSPGAMTTARRANGESDGDDASGGPK